MNLPAKVFVIVNLVLGVIFATLSVSLYAKKVNYAEQAEAAIANYNSEIDKRKAAEATAKAATDKLEIATNDYEAKLNTADSKIKGLEDVNASQARNIDELKASFSQASVAMNGIREDLKGMLKAKVLLETRIKSLSAELKKANDDRRLAQRQSVEISASMKNIEEELVATRKQNADLNGRILAANNTLKEYQKRFGTLDVVAGPVDPVRGEVYRVMEENDLVIIRLGSDDKVKKGMEMVISRGNEYISKVTVENVEKDVCSAIIDKDLTENAIRVGDIAETL